MTGEQQGRAKHLSGPFRTWMRYAEDTENLVHLTHEGLGMAIESAEMFRAHIEEHHEGSVDEEHLKFMDWKAERARKEADAGYPTLHAHSLLGLWGALECLVEDVFKESIKAQPELLGGDALSKIKLPVSVLYGSDDDRANVLLLELTRNLGADRKLGVGQFEVLLDPLNLSGGVPCRVREAVLHAQQIRHIWAHRGGAADAVFVKNFPGRAQVGERVNMDANEFMRLMHGIHMYALVILNRHFTNIGEELVSVHCPGYEGVLGGDDDQNEEVA